MVNYTRTPEYELWVSLHAHVIKHRNVPSDIAPFTGFSQRPKATKRRSSVGSSHNGKRVNFAESQNEEGQNVDAPLVEQEQEQEQVDPGTPTQEVRQAAAILVVQPQTPPQQAESRESEESRASEPVAAAGPLENSTGMLCLFHCEQVLNTHIFLEKEHSMDHRIVEKALLLNRYEDKLQEIKARYREKSQNTKMKQKETEDAEARLSVVQHDLLETEARLTIVQAEVLEAEVGIEVINHDTRQKEKKMEEGEAHLHSIQDDTVQAEARLTMLRVEILQAEAGMKVMDRTTKQEKKKLEDVEARLAALEKYHNQVKQWSNDHPKRPEEPIAASA